MSARSINCLKTKGQQVGLPDGTYFRRYKYITDGASAYMPPNPLGWFYTNRETGKEYYLGADLDAALSHLTHWNESHGTGSRTAG